MKAMVAAKFIFAVSISLLGGGNANELAISSLENSLAGTIGAVIGGVITALAFVFAVIAGLMKANSDNEKLSARYKLLTNTLNSDVTILIWTLASAIALPFLRRLDLPFIEYPATISAIFTKNQLITSIEIFTLVLLISVLFEICHCMFQCINSDTTITRRKS